jgi:DNA-binding LytR/AlgR family response regulator
MMRTLIVDDEALNLDELKHSLTQYKDVDVVAEASNTHEALSMLEQHKLDLVFLDIQMEDETSGLEIAKTISEQENPPQIIFVTAYPQYAHKAFDYQPRHYLTKPVSDEKLEEALQRARVEVDGNSNRFSAEDYKKMKEALQPTTPSITFRYKGKDINNDRIYPTAYLKPQEILYIYKVQLGGTVDIYTINGQQYERVKQTLKELENKLVPCDFFRIHRSFIVNLRCVQEVRPRAAGEENYLVLLKETSVKLPVSRNKYEALKLALESL